MGQKLKMLVVVAVAGLGILASSCAKLTPEAQEKVDALDKTAATLRAQLEIATKDFVTLKAEYEKLMADKAAGKPVDLERLVSLVPAMKAAAENAAGVVQNAQGLWKQREEAIAAGAPWWRALPWTEIVGGISILLLGQNVIQRRALGACVGGVETAGTPDTKAAIEAKSYGSGVFGALVGNYLSGVVEAETKCPAAKG